MLYSYTSRPQPQAGTGSLVLNPSFSLPSYSVQGPGNRFTGLKVMSPPQMYYMPAQTLIGISGISTGSFNSQPLNDEDVFNRAGV